MPSPRPLGNTAAETYHFTASIGGGGHGPKAANGAAGNDTYMFYSGVNSVTQSTAAIIADTGGENAIHFRAGVSFSGYNFQGSLNGGKMTLTFAGGKPVEIHNFGSLANGDRYTIYVGDGHKGFTGQEFQNWMAGVSQSNHKTVTNPAYTSAPLNIQASPPDEDEPYSWFDTPTPEM